MYQIFSEEFNYNMQDKLDFLAKKVYSQKLVIYGAGSFSRFIFENFDTSKLNICYIADKKYNSNSAETFYGYKTLSPIELKTIDADAIVTFVTNFEIIEDYLEDDILVNCKNSDLKIISLV